MPTPHNEAQKGQIAKTVLMPGDPLRAKLIAENYLEDAVLVNNVRGVQGYTGKWKGVPVTVMASGMGMPAISIYSWELYESYGVENIIRVGSAGSISNDVNLMDVVIAQGACTDSNINSKFGLPGIFCPIADYELMSRAIESAKEMNAEVKVGNIFSSDSFYSPTDINKKWSEMGVLAVEMEAAALYAVAAYWKKRALTICTISDHILKGEELPADERRTAFGQMIEIALNTAVKMA